jgi:hypothetical protein
MFILHLAKNEIEILEIIASELNEKYLLSVNHKSFRSLNVPLLNFPYPDRVYESVIQTLNYIYEKRN